MFNISNAMIVDLNTKGSNSWAGFSIHNSTNGKMIAHIPLNLRMSPALILLNGVELTTISRNILNTTHEIASVNLTNGNSEVEVAIPVPLSGNYQGNCSVIPEFPFAEQNNVLLPYQQMKEGIPFDQIKCSSNLNFLLVIREDHTVEPACVKSNAMPRLENQGWITLEKFESMMPYPYPLQQPKAGGGIHNASVSSISSPPQNVTDKLIYFGIFRYSDNLTADAYTTPFYTLNHQTVTKYPILQNGLGIEDKQLETYNTYCKNNGCNNDRPRPEIAYHTMIPIEIAETMISDPDLHFFVMQPVVAPNIEVSFIDVNGTKYGLDIWLP